jgi:DNA-binding NtrC family response regulator
LAEYLLRKHVAATGRIVTDIAAEARDAFAIYSWPGNVRELADVIEHAVVLSSGRTITLRNLPGRIAGGEGRVYLKISRIATA